MSRVVGVDLGERRVGIAVSNGERTVAVAHSVVTRETDEHAAATVALVASEIGATEIVVGLPLRLDGTRGPASEGAEAFAERLGHLVSIPVRLWDERLSTVEAERRLAEAGAGGRRRRRVVDGAAAAIILQSYLDGIR